MYTWEMQQFFEQRNYQLDDYIDFYRLYMNSPQVNLVKYEETVGDRSKYLIQTNDGFSGWVWIKRKEE